MHVYLSIRFMSVSSYSRVNPFKAVPFCKLKTGLSCLRDPWLILSNRQSQSILLRQVDREAILKFKVWISFRHGHRLFLLVAVTYLSYSHRIL